MYKVYLKISDRLGYIPVSLAYTTIDNAIKECDKCIAKAGNTYVVGFFEHTEDKAKIVYKSELQHEHN
jgi:hypothetical protein